MAIDIVQTDELEIDSQRYKIEALSSIPHTIPNSPGRGLRDLAVATVYRASINSGTMKRGTLTAQSITYECMKPMPMSTKLMIDAGLDATQNMVQTYINDENEVRHIILAKKRATNT